VDLFSGRARPGARRRLGRRCGQAARDRLRGARLLGRLRRDPARRGAVSAATC